MAVNIKIGDYDVSKYVESPITINQRLDEVLDSATFQLVYNWTNEGENDFFAKAIEPFTMCTLGGDYFYASSVCHYLNSTQNDNSEIVYIHEVTLYELTKRLETFILGSKAFSIVNGKSDYNTDYDRIRIIKDLMQDKYKVSFTLDTQMKVRMSQSREYFFGAGTTMFDALKEIMANENCIPRLKWNAFTKSLIISYDDFNVVSSTTYSINFPEKIESTQSVDEYCSEIETELSEVSGSVTPTTVTLAATGTDDIISADNACLVLPTNIDRVTKLEILGKNLIYANNNKRITVQVSADNDKCMDFNKSVVGEVLTTSKAYSTIQQWFGDDVASFFSAYVTAGEISSVAGVVLCCILGAEKNVLAIGYNQPVKDSNGNDTAQNITFSNRSGDYSIDITSYLLNKQQYDLLEATTKPKYLYYEHGTKIIGGFNIRENDDFWKSKIYGTISSFMTGNFADKNGHFVCTASSTGGNANALPHVFRVTYYPLAPFTTRVTKKGVTIPTNITARSYNNGANSVDLNQLLPQMRKNCNLLGLNLTTITTCYDDKINVGYKTQFGYVISKSRSYRNYNGDLTESIVYICSENKQVVAQALTRATQYEATNLPQTGIIDRFVYLDLDGKLNGAFENPYLVIRGSNTSDDGAVAKPLVFVYADMDYGYARYAICEADDNYSIGSRLVEGQKHYYANTPVPYADSDNCRENYLLSILQVDLTKDTVSNIRDGRIDLFSSLPKIPNYNMLALGYYGKGTESYSVLVHKDPRERLIFVIKLNGGED